MSPLLKLGVAATAVTLSACVYVPVKTQVYDAECRTMVNHMVLEGGQVAAIQRCENQGCLALIVAASAVTAATIIVSGSIVIAGNVATWLERMQRCPASPSERDALARPPEVH